MLKIFIRERRMERHMSQTELANQLVNKSGRPLDQSELSKYEKGKIPIPLDVILQITDILNCKVEDLVRRE